MDAVDPSLFIGSSSEGLTVALALQAELDQVCEPLVWSQGAFEPTGTTIGTLLDTAQNFRLCGPRAYARRSGRKPGH